MEGWDEQPASSPQARFSVPFFPVSCPSGSPHRRQSEARQGGGGAPGPGGVSDPGGEQGVVLSPVSDTRACLDLMLILGLLSYHLMGVSDEGCRVRPHLSLEGMVLLRTRWA